MVPRPPSGVLRAALAGIVAAVCPVFALPAAGPAFAAESFAVATFNAENLTRPKVHMKFGFRERLRGEDRKKWDRPGYRDRRFATATARVARYIARHAAADILALTEVGDRRDVLELKDRLAAENAVYPHVAVCDCRERAGGRPTARRVAVLSRVPLFDVRRSLPGREGYFAEPTDREDERDTGIARGMRVGFRAAGRMFALYVVHLTSELGGHERDAKRIAQASILRRLILKPLEAGGHVIVAGDLNDRRRDPALLRVRGLDDIWPDLAQTGLPKYFRDDGERWTYLFKGDREQIDHILLSPSIVQAVYPRKGIRATTGPAPGKDVSDHRPLVVTLTFR